MQDNDFKYEDQPCTDSSLSHCIRYVNLLTVFVGIIFNVENVFVQATPTSPRPTGQIASSLRGADRSGA